MDLGMELTKIMCDTPEAFERECLKWAGKGVVRGRILYAYGLPVAERKERRGGQRIGAGRKHKEKSPRVTITIRVEVQTKQKLDELKGNLSYGKLIDRIAESL